MCLAVTDEKGLQNTEELMGKEDTNSSMVRAETWRQKSQFVEG